MESLRPLNDCSVTSFENMKITRRKSGDFNDGELVANKKCDLFVLYLDNF